MPERAREEVMSGPERPLYKRKGEAKVPRSNRIQKPTSGRTSVVYRDARGHTFEAKVTGGTGTTLDLKLTSHPRAVTALLTGIEKQTALTDTNVWF